LIKENQNIEWKESWRDEFLKWICGFANADGGKLFIGINDNGEVIGIDNATKLLDEIPNKVRNHLGHVIDVELKNEKGKEYQKLLNVSKATATRDLYELTDKFKMLIRIGEVGAGTIYKLIGS